MKFLLLLSIFIIPIYSLVYAQNDSIIVHQLAKDVTATIELPKNFSSKLSTQLIFFALPNGNTTAQTMGKKLLANDDWHFDIQHIAAQTKFIRQRITNENIVVVYLENKYKSWPLWKKNRHK